VTKKENREVGAKETQKTIRETRAKTTDKGSLEESMGVMSGNW
jgi:hypothetical protein